MRVSTGVKRDEGGRSLGIEERKGGERVKS